MPFLSRLQSFCLATSTSQTYALLFWCRWQRKLLLNARLYFMTKCWQVRHHIPGNSCLHRHFNSIALRMAKTPQSFGHSECNRINNENTCLPVLLCQYCLGMGRRHQNLKPHPLACSPSHFSHSENKYDCLR